MASFPDLRPKRRSAKAEGKAVRPLKPSVLLAVSAALLLTAFLAVSELATLRGTKAHDASVFLTRELGSPLSSAPLVRAPAPNHTVKLNPRGFAVESAGQSIAVASADVAAAPWRRFQHGVSRRTPFGLEAISVHGLRTEQSLVVERPQGEHTWRWSLSTQLRPRVGPKGSVQFIDPRTWQVSDLRIAPVRIYDGSGKDVTPDDLAWSLGGTKARPQLQLSLDDKDLPRPYVIDPIVIRSATAGVGFTSTDSGGAQTANLSLTQPSGAVVGDLLIAHVTVQMSGTTLTVVPPSGWTSILKQDDGTTVSVATYYRRLTTGDTGPYSFSWENPAGTAVNRTSAGGITAYAGVASPAIDSSAGATGGNNNANVSGITTSGTNRMLVYVEGNQSSRTQTTPPTVAGGAMVERYDRQNIAAAANADRLAAAQLTAAATTGQANSGNGRWAAQVIALNPDVTAPSAPSLALAENPDTNDSYISGTTYYYRPASATGATMRVTASGSDTSGIQHATFPGMAVAGGFVPITPQNVTSPYQQNYTWVTNASDSGAKNVTVTDWNNNTGASASFTVTPDSGSPSSSLTVTEGASPGLQLFLSLGGGSYRYYYNPTATGDFTITDGAGDAISGVRQVDFPAITAVTGFTGSAASDTTSTYDSGTYQFDNTNVAAPSNKTVTVTDNVNNTASDTVAFVRDVTAPAGEALTVNSTAASGPGTTSYDTDGDFTIGTRTDYTEAQSATASGLVSSTLVRTNASYSSADVCGAFGSPTTIVGNPSEAGLTTGCWRYTLTGTDNVGNTASISTTVKVDTSNPSAPTFSFASATGGAYYPGSGTRVYFKPDAASGGAFDVTASSSDSDTGIASYTFPAGSGLGTNWSGSGSGAARTYSYTATATTTGAQSVSATNGAGRSASASFDLTADSTAPTGGALTVNATAASGGGTSSYDTDGAFTIGTRTDYSETQSATASGLVSSTLVRTSATYSSPDVCGAFGSPTTIVGNPDQTGLSTGCYRYTLTGTDNVGNAVSLSTTVKVDTSDPSTPSFAFGSVAGGAYHPGSGTRVYFRPDAATGTFDITASSSDSDTGVASYTFPAGAALGTNWSGSGSGATRTYSYTATATSNGSQNVGSTNNAGRNASSSFDLTLDSTAPAGGSLTVNGMAASAGGTTSYDTDGNFTIGTRTDYSETQGATASGLATSTLVRTNASYSSADVCGSFGSPSTVSGNPDQNGLATGCYRYTLTGTDNVGNAVSVITTVKVDTSDPSAPALTLSNATGGAHYPGSGTRVYFKPDAANGGFDIAASSSDGDTGIGSYGFPAGSALGTNWSGSGSGNSRTYSYTATATSNGSQNVSATNNAGRSASSSFDVTLDSTAPGGGALTVNGTAASGGGSSSYDSDGNFTIGTRTDYSESQSSTASGLASSTLVRTSASFSGTDVCGAFGSPSTITGNPAQNGLSTGCYRYTLSGTDNVGNAVSIVTTVKVDTSAPSDPSLTLANATGGAYYSGSGTRAFFKPDAANGGFDVTASSTDGDTGVASYSFPAGGSLGTNWSGSGSGATRTYSYTGTATTNGTQNVTATNNAGGISGNGTFDVTADSTAPASGAVTVNGGAATGGTSVSYDADGSFPIDARTDYSETGSPTESGLASSTLVRTTATFSSADTCGAFGSPSTITGNPNQSGLSTGCYKYTLTGTDNVGNAVSIATIVKVDTSAPSNPSLSISNATGGTHYPGAGTQVFFKPSAANGGFDLAASSSDADTGISGYTFPTAGSMGANWSVSGSGAARTYSFTPTAGEPGSKSVSASNNAGGSASSNFTVTADSTAPTTTVQCNGAACLNGTYYTSAPVSVTLSGNDGSGAGVQKIRYTTDGTDPTPLNGSDYSGAISINSTATVKFRAYDNLGNEEAVGSQDILLDGTPPTVPLTVTENPASGAQQVSGTTLFYRPGAAGGTFRVAADAQDAQTGITSVDFPSIANVTGGGSQTSSPYREDYTWNASTTNAASHNVVATNGAGATTPEPFTLTQDATAPSGQTLTLTGANAPYYGSASVGFSLGDGNDGSGSGLDTSTRTVTRESAPLNGDNCGTFSADAGTYTSPDTAVAGGNCYRYSFTIADNVGNVSAPVTATAKVDTDDPTVSLTDPGTPVAGTVGLSATGSDTSTAVQQVVFERAPAGGSTWTTIGTDTTAPYSASWNTTALSDGLYDVRAVATDVSSHTSTSLVANRRVDNTAPNTTIDSTPADPSNDTTPTFAFSSSETGSTFECRIDGGSWSPCSSPETLGALGAGSHTFEVRATDQAGNVDASPASHTWTIDLAAPNTTIDSSPSDPSADATPDFTFSSSETGSTFECRIDGGSWTSCTSPHTISPALTGGSHSFEVRATDPAGNTDGSPASYTWTVDLTAPNTTIDSNPPDPSNDTTPDFSFSSSEGSSTFECRVDGGSWTSCTSPHTISPALSAGSHTFEVRATDPAGNTDGSPASYTWTVDLTAPNTAIDSNPTDPSGDTTPTFAFSANEGGSTFQCRIDGGSWTSCSSPETLSALGAGSHTFEVRATDIAGNTDGTPASYSWTIDLTAPDTTIDSNPSDPSGNTTPSFTFTSNETGSTFECRIDGGSWTSCTSPHTISPALTGGSHTFDVRATDQVGNTDATPASYTWTIDLTAPDTTIDSSPADPSNDTTPDFSFSSSEGSSTFECRVDGGSWTSCTSPHTISPALSGGSHTFEVRATDQFGNTDATPASRTWTVDVTAPNTTIDSSPADPSGDTTPTFAFSANEGGSTFQCRIDGGSWSSCSSPETLSALGAGSHTFEVRATDIAGNTDGTPASYSWTIDLTEPNTTIDSAPQAVDNDPTPNFTFSSSETGSTFECRIDGGSWSSCTSPHTVSPALTEGSHTFEVRTTDQAGNTDATPASHTWTVDLGPPTVSISSPTTYLNGSDPTTYPVAALSPDGDVTRVDFYECSNGSTDCATGTWSQFGTDNSAPYSADWSTPGADGLRAIRALAVDAGSNTGEHVRTITIDRTAPTGVTVSYPNNYVFGSFAITTGNGTDPDVNASSGALERRTGDLVNDSCSSYSGWAAASSPDTLASTKCAQYRYRLADNAGNWTTATSSNEVKSDTNAPTSIQADPGANLRQSVNLTAVASDTGGSSLASVAFQHRPSSGGSWTTITSDTTSPYGIAFDTTSVADGLYDFRTVATDVAGNAEASPVVVANRRVDNTAPSATMLSPGNPVGGTVALTSNASDTGGSGIATVAYELAPNGGSFNSQAASWDTTLVSDGLYDLHVIATDAAGNSTTSALITTRVDNTPPAVDFTSPAAAAVVTGTVNLVASASDASPASPAVAFAYKLASDPPASYTATGASWNTTVLPGGDGLYDIRARATDDAGNTTSVEHANIRVDNAPPTVAITAPPAAINGSVPSPTTFSANASDPGGSGIDEVQFFECSNQSADCATGVWSPLGNIAAPGPYSVSWTIPGADGNHALAAVATDNAGHPSSAIRNVDVDRNAPDTTIVSKPADPSNAVTPTFTFSSSETGSTFECSIDGGAFAPCTTPHNISGLTDNTHTFDVRATDPAGNTDASPVTWTWHRDTNYPIGTLDSPGANIRQVVTLTSTESDPAADGYASGLASVSYEYSANGTTWALIGTLSSAPFDSIMWNTTAIADGVYQLRIVVQDVAGNITNTAPVPNVRIDNTPPTTSQDDPGQYLRATKPLTGSAGDSGSGIDHVDFERGPTGGGPWTLVATDSTPGDGFGVSFDTTTVADGHYDFRTVAYDVAGNQAAATPVTDRLVDNTPPNATMSSPGAHMRGSVNLSSSIDDPGGSNASGVVGVAYEYSANGGGSWQPTGSSFDTSAVPDGNVDLHVIATDAAGNSTTSPAVTSLIDNTKPATTDNAPAGWQSSTVTVTLTPNDGGSGVNVTEYSVDGNPTYTVGTTVIIPAPANGSNDGAHTIAYFSVDNAGNIETVKSTTVLIDATPPTCPSCSAADYLRGTVTLSASPSESGSGIQSVEFQYADAGGSSWTSIGTDTTGSAPYSVDWNTVPVPDGHYDLRILVTDNAANVTTTNLPDKVVDNTAPDVATVGAPTEGQLVTGTIAIAASASDVTSPIASVRFYVRGSLLGTDTTAPFSLSWNTTTGPDGAATIQVVVEDMAGNSTSSSVRNVSVDNVSPTPTLADPGQNLSGTVSLSASSDPDTTQVDFERRPAGGGAWVTIASDTTLPWGTSLDTTALADGLYDFRAVATDQIGQSGASPIRSNIRIDNTNPAGSITTPANGATVGGSSVALGGSYSDGGSGVDSVRYDVRPTGGGSWSAIATSTSSPFNATWDATTVATGSYDLRPVITDRAGNVFTGGTITVDVDVTAPTVVLTNPGATIAGVVTLNATVSGSGATQVAFSSTPAGGAAWSSIGTDTSSPWSTGFDTTKLGDGVYDLRAVVSDGLGNTSNDVVTNIRIDNTAPRVVSSSPSDGLTVPSASAIGLVTNEPATPIGVTLDGNSTVAPVISGTNINYNTGPIGVGPHTLAGEVQDSSGKKAPFRVHFTVWSGSGSPAPHVDKNTSSDSSTTVESADGFSSATMPAGVWSTSTSDWIVLRIAPMAAPSGLTNGFTAGPHALDVTARWALAGTEVHQFSQPIGILIRSNEKGLVPATFENGNWRVIARVPAAGTLPAGWDDGFYSDGNGFHILTKHLSVFALLHDVEAPNPPQNVRGFVGSNGLTIRWTEGADNSGTYDFVTVFSGSTDTGHYGVDYIAASIGAWAVGDPRIFKLKETDLAGNESTLTKALVPVPSLVGKTPDQAADALRERGFTLGTMTPGGDGRAGTITGPEGLVLAEEGATIDVTVAPGASVLTTLVFRVHTAPKFKPSVRKKIAARISLTRAARVTAELFSPRGVKIYTWRFSVRAGRSIVKLNIPRQVRRPGSYSMRWTARAGRDLASTRLKIRMVGIRAVKFAEPIEVVLSGQAPRGARAKLPKRKPKVVLATGIETTFDAAANRKTDARVIVVDVDEFGVAFVRDLHTVFPAVKIVALSSSPRTMARALKAGAVIALPRSTPPARLAKVIQKLLSPPKATKPKRPLRSQGPPAKS